MKILIKRSLSVLLTTAMIFGVMQGQSVSAATSKGSSNPYGATIVAKDANVTVAESKDETYKYVSTYNKKENSVTIEQLLLSTGEAVNTYSFDAIANDTASVENVSTPEKAANTENDVSNINNNNADAIINASSFNQSTYTNYEYTETYSNPYVIELRRPDGSLNGTYYFKTKETTANQSFVNAFITDVERINTLEGNLIKALGTALFLSSLSIVISLFTDGIGAPLSAYLLSIGSSDVAVNIAGDLDAKCNSANRNYYLVYNNSTVYY
ncbi:MAG: geobacillin-26 family protein [Anaerocolumna sp.]